MPPGTAGNLVAGASNLIAGASMTRRYPIGAEPQPDGTTHFRVWAPRRKTVEVLIDNRATLLTREPDGHHAGFPWTDESWKGGGLRGQVIYELHVGTFTREGTFNAARRELAELAALGITAIEIMPLADFPGRFGWGYDGVGLFAPVAIYGTPDDFRAFVNEAHSVGI